MKRHIPALVLFVSGIIFSTLYVRGEQVTTIEQLPPQQVAQSTPSIESGPAPTPLSKVLGQFVQKKTLAPIQFGPIPSPSAQPVSTAAQSMGNPIPTPAAQESQYQVSLSINGQASFSVEVPKGSNQCDVLPKALDQGKISSLNMRYDSNYGTYAVYQINEIGSKNSVWWVYKVNGQSPSQGCSYIKVNNNDNIEWKYVGS